MIAGYFAQDGCTGNGIESFSLNSSRYTGRIRYDGCMLYLRDTVNNDVLNVMIGTFKL